MHTLIVSELKSVNFELLQTSTKLVVVDDRDTDVIDNLIRNPVIQEIVQYRRVHMCEEITMRWAWGLFLCVCTLYVLTLARSIWRIIFKKTKSPKLSVVMFVSTVCYASVVLLHYIQMLRDTYLTVADYRYTQLRHP